MFMLYLIWKLHTHLLASGTLNVLCNPHNLTVKHGNPFVIVTM